MEPKTVLLVLGVAALGGGLYYLYKSGSLVGSPSMAAQNPYAAPTYLGPVQRLKVNVPMPNVSGYHW